MENVFISSLMRGDWVGIRQAAKEAVESLGMRAVLAEGTGANDESSRRTLLDQIGTCDVLLLLLGAEYGTPGVRGKSPVEEEFEEGLRLGLPVLALVQEGEREQAQDAFVGRVRGGWEHGRFAPGFRGAGDVGLAVVRALTSVRESGPAEEQARRAGSRAVDLAQGSNRTNPAQRPRVQLIAVPIVRRPLLDALRLRDPALPDELATGARRSRLVSNSMGITAAIRADGIHLRVGNNAELSFLVGLDGAVVAEAEVSGSGTFGGSVLVAARVLDALGRSARFVLEVWDILDARDEVRQAQVVVVVPHPQYRVYALSEPGNSLSMGMYAAGPIVAPDPPLLVRRQDLQQPDTLERLRAEIRHRFELAGALNGSDKP